MFKRPFTQFLSRRRKTEYILAKKVNGELVDANFKLSSPGLESNDKSLSLSPSITANIKVSGQPRLVKIEKIVRVIKSDVAGRISSYNNMTNIGYIGSVSINRFQAKIDD